MLRKTLFVVGATLLLAACSSKKDDTNANVNDSVNGVVEVVEETVVAVPDSANSNAAATPAQTAPAQDQKAQPANQPADTTKAATAAQK